MELKKQKYDELYIMKKQKEFEIWNLTRIKKTEIIHKINAIVWAAVWSITGIACLISDEAKLAVPFIAMPAAGFWILLVRSTGSIAEYDREIEVLKKEFEKLERIGESEK